jgi:hypothetical protein
MTTNRFSRTSSIAPVSWAWSAATATRWLDRPRNAKEGFGGMIKPLADLRRTPFDWEVWHRCEVFRAELERRLARKP